ncbi:MAG TPA: PilN domain-containing protein [Thermaerobacter sp.]
MTASHRGRGLARPSGRGPAWVPRMNLLAPRLPARRMQMAARWTVTLAIVALLDVGVVLAWFAVGGLAAAAEQRLARAEARRAAAEAAMAPLVPTVQEKVRLERRRQALQVIGSAPVEAATVVAVARAALPEGVRLMQLEFAAADGSVRLQGEAPSFASVDAYVAALRQGGFFRQVWVQQVRREGAGAGGVAFDLGARAPRARVVAGEGTSRREGGP